MNADHASPGNTEELHTEAIYSGERLLLHLTIGAGYAFLGFFGWLLTQ